MYECYFIGTTSLLKECVSLAQKFHFHVLGVFSDDLAIRKWCQSVNLTCKTSSDIKKITDKYDYLFSIVNPKIITASDLSKVKKKAINYHDSLLPQYAGVNATTWAILNNEKKHGISWHLIAEGIDTGDIIKQQEIIVDTNETAFSLNLKCYNEAIQSFPTILDNIVKNTLITHKQNLALRSYYSQADRPFGNGFINWNDSSENIARLIRALDFGISINPKTTSKVIINNKPYSIKKFKVINATKKMPPGTIVSFNDKNLVIATLDDLISIEKIKTMHGVIKPLDELEIHTSKSIKVFNNEELEKIQALAKHFSKYETYWIQQIKNISLNSNLLPAYQNEKQKIKTAWKLVIPKEALSTLGKADNELIKSVIATISFYFYKINNYESITLKILKYFNYHLSYYPVNLPCNIDVNHSENIFSGILNHINELLNNHVYEPDLFCRNDELTHSLSLIPVLIIPPSDKNHNKQNIDHDGLIIEIKLSENEIILTGKSTRKFSVHIESLLKFMPEHLNNIISHINAKQDPSQYSILSKEEETLLKSFNNTKEEIDTPHQTILQKILLRCEENPDSIAVVEYGQSYSYKELLDLSNLLAHQIKNNYKQYYNRELSTQAVFTIHCQHGLNYILAVLATIRLGCIFSPTDPSYPLKRVQHIVHDSGCAVVLNDVLDRKLELNATFTLNIELVKLKQEKQLNEINLLEVQQLLYLMYTSGSTGEPKGVKVSQINFNNLLEWYTQLCLTRKDKTFVISSFAFDLTQKNIIAPLTVGGQVHFRDNKQYYEPKEIINHIAKYKITHINCTSSLFFHLIENISLLPKLKSLSQVVLGVGLFTGHNLLEFYQQNPKVKIYNSYGPAECTDVCSFYKITHKDIINDNPIPIGIPISNNNIFILDKYNQLMPFGIPGELCVTGINVSHGYFNKSDLTKKVFLKSILSISDYTGYHYHTGDVAYLAMNKNLYFLNRTDTQIKIRGYRVELGEIEAVLIKHPNIKESKVICREINDNKNLIAFVSTTTSNIQQEEISNHLKEYLPHYMLPHFIYIIDKLPLNHHNKIDQDALFKLAAEKDISNNIIPPMIPIEHRLCRLWSKFLNKEIKTTQINFFEAGGDSLLATKLAYAIEEECNVNMKTIDIYEHSVLYDLATFISNKKPDDDALIIHPSVIPKSNMVSEQQKNIIFLEKTHPKFSHLYNSMYCFKIKGNLNLDLLKKSIEIIYNSLPILKENYTFDSYNIIKTHSDKPLEISILEVPEDKIEEHITNKKLNISKDNLFSVYIFITSSTDILLYFKIHHCISDAESMGTICRYISQVYEALLNQNPLPKIDQIYNYDQYATWQNKYFSTNQYQEKVAFYANRFKELTPTSLPYDNIPTGKFIIYSQCEFFDFENKELYSQIFTFCHQHKISLFSFLWAVISLQIHHYNHQEKIFAGSFAANRYPASFAETIGLFANLFILRADIDPAKTFIDYAIESHKNIISHFEHQHIMTKHLFQKLKLSNQDNMSAILPLGIELINYSQLKDLQFPDCMVTPKIVDHANCKFNLSFRFFQESDDYFSCIIEYNKHMFNEETIHSFKKHFIDLVTIVTTLPNILIKNVSISAPFESTIPEHSTTEKYHPSVAINNILNKVAAAYKKALDLSDIDLDENFYALGGESMMGIVIAEDLETTENIIINIEDFFQYPTIRSLSNRIEQLNATNATEAQDSQYQPIRLFNKIQKPSSNIFCIHPVANTANVFKLFSEYFNDIQFYAIDSYNYYHQNKIMNITDIASLYITELIKYQNKGPYYISGWSYGGIVAYEMAQQLMAAGHEVATLYLLDSFALSKTSKTYLLKLVNHFFNMRKEFSTEINTNLSLQHHLREMLELEFSLIDHYQFKPYQGRVILFKAQHAFEYPLTNDAGNQFFNFLQEEVFNDSTNGFANLISDLKTILIDTHHHRLLNPPYGLQIANAIEKDVIMEALPT